MTSDRWIGSQARALLQGIQAGRGREGQHTWERHVQRARDGESCLWRSDHGLENGEMVQDEVSRLLGPRYAAFVAHS